MRSLRHIAPGKHGMTWDDLEPPIAWGDDHYIVGVLKQGFCDFPFLTYRMRVRIECRIFPSVNWSGGQGLEGNELQSSENP